MHTSLFGTSGIRGSAEDLFTRQFCFDIGKAFVKYLNNHTISGPIAIGMDPRTSGIRIKSDVLAGLATSGNEIYDQGVTPIPSLNWLLKSTPIAASVMITGSHIAPELNGIKFFAHDEEVLRGDQDEIEQIYHDLKEKEPVKDSNFLVYVDSRAHKLYKKMLTGLIKEPLPHWKVALDCANGAQSMVMPDLLRSLGLEIVEVNCEVNERFIARDTDTDDKAEVGMLRETILSEKCDFGVAFDGDGDRSVFLNEKGEFVLGEYSCSLVAKYSNLESVVTTISSSQVIESVVPTVYRTRVGSPYVVEEMKNKNVQFGFEQNGGALSAEIMYTRDGGSLLMKVLNIFATQNTTFSQMLDTLPKFYMARTKVDYEWEMQDEIMTKAKEHFKGVRVDETDGLKIWINDTTWLLFRSSQNAPEFRVFAESKTEEEATRMKEEGISFVENLVREIKSR